MESAVHKARVFAASLIALLAVSTVVAQAPMLIVKGAWARQTPGSDVAAVYLSLSNTTLQPIIVVGVHSPLASHSMMHESSVSNGQSQMRMKETIVIAPGKTVSFSPGGTHVMLSGLKHNITVGQSVPLVLLLADGSKVAVAALVKPLVP
jgi:periplasmic copper chaperone A